MTEAERQEQDRLIAAARREGFEEGRQLGLDAGLARGLDTGLGHLGAAIATRRTPAAPRESRPAARPSRAAGRELRDHPARIITRTTVLPDRRSAVAIERDRRHGERIRDALLASAAGPAEPAPAAEPSFNEMAAAYWGSQ